MSGVLSSQSSSFLLIVSRGVFADTVSLSFTDSLEMDSFPLDLRLQISFSILSESFHLLYAREVGLQLISLFFDSEPSSITGSSDDDFLFDFESDGKYNNLSFSPGSSSPKVRSFSSPTFLQTSRTRQSPR